MRQDPSSLFNTPEFQAILHKYEEMRENKTQVYFESHELAQLAQYYAYQEEGRASEDVINYGLQLHPDSLELLLFKCSTLGIKGWIHKALSLLESIPDQKNREVRLAYAGLCLDINETEIAERVFEQLAKDEGEDTNTLLDIANLYIGAKMDEEANKWLQKAYEQSPNDIEVLESMAEYFFSFDDVEQAAVFYNKLLDENPYNIEYWTQLTRCYLKSENIEKAMESAEFALAIDANNLICIELKGYCFQLLGDSASACECYRRIEQAMPNKARIRMVIMICYYEDKKYPETLEYCNKLLDSGELEKIEKAMVYHKRAICHLINGNFEEAEKDVESGLDCDKEFSDLYLVQGELFLSEGKTIEADSSFQRAESLSMEKLETIQQIATTYMRYEYFEEAIDTYFWMEKEYPEEVKQFYSYIAFCYHRRKDKDNMFKYLVRSCFYTPGSITTPIFTEKELGEDKLFFDLAQKISEQIQNGNIDLSLYL